MTDAMLGGIEALSVQELRSEWRRLHRSAPPLAYTADLLVRGIAYRLQEQRHGKLAIEHRREIDQLAGIGVAPARKVKGAGSLRSGSRLVRRWRGTTYTVAVLEGEFEYQEKRFKSLSEIAREITGTRWSGPRFFGCRS